MNLFITLLGAVKHNKFLLFISIVCDVTVFFLQMGLGQVRCEILDVEYFGF